MDDMNTKLDMLLDKIKEDISDIKADLKLHMARTEANEKRIEVAEKTFEEVKLILPDVRRIIKWWPILSGIVILIITGKPELFSVLIKYLSGGTTP